MNNAAKSKKAIEQLNAIQAAHEATIQHQQTEIENLKSKKSWKKVAVNPNKKFVNIDDIKKAQEEAAASQMKKDAKKQELEAKKASEAIAAATLESMCFQWQLEL